MRANALARPEQTPSHVPAVMADCSALDADYQAARAAAPEWFSQAMKSMGEYRDAVRCTLVRSIEDEAEAAAASHLFNQGFAEGVAKVIAGVRHA